MTKKLLIAFAITVSMMFAPLFAQQAGPLNIMLTNDDGYLSPALHALRDQLIAAGHNVTVVAPLENQSGTGGSSTIEEWVEVIEQFPGVWSVPGTPMDTVLVGLTAVMADNPPDLVISGMNFGQNLGQFASNTSGTIGAALAALFRDVPAISVSVGVILEEANATPYPFPSTFASLAPAAAFMVRLVEELQLSSKDGSILPPRTMLNINFPVPYDEVVQGIKFTRLGHKTFLTLQCLDVNGVIPNGGGPVLVVPDFQGPPDPVADADTTAYWNGYIGITVMDGDMSSLMPPSTRNKLKERLKNLEIY